jgi:lysyl-tRNA synthetase class 2
VRDGKWIHIRTDRSDVVHQPAGDAQPGDLIEVRDTDAPPRIVRRFAGEDYPGLATEVVRMPRARLDALRGRAIAVAAVRAFFHERDFLEIDVPVAVEAPGLEVHLDPVDLSSGRTLITSPEFQMKRLLAAGLTNIYTMCHCFRAGERGKHHNVEFTMLEWYRGFSDLEAIRRDTEQLVAEVCRAVSGAAIARVEGREIDVTPPWPVRTVASLFEELVGTTIAGDEDVDTLRERLTAAGIDLGTATAWDDMFYEAFVNRVDPALAAMDRPLFVTEWPVRLAALAKRRSSNPAVVERFEAYVGGIELANAFGELTEPTEQRARFEHDIAERTRRNKTPYHIDERLMDALEEGLPPSGGIAMGIDRLVMLATGTDEIANVLAFTDTEL